MCASNLEVKPKPHLARKRILLVPLCFAKKVKISHAQCLSICLRVLYVWSCYFFDEQISN